MPSLEDPYAILDSNTDPELLYNQSAADGNPLKGSNIIDKQNKQLEYEMERPATFLNRPMTRA